MTEPVKTTTPLIFKKMSDVMRDVKAITKDQKNVAQGFKFRGIDQFVNALYPALTKHGVFMAPSCKSQSHEIKEVTRSNGKPGVDKHVHIEMAYTFYAEDGSWVTVGPIPAEGLDSGDKATNKALSAALKYALIQTFSIPTEDMAEADLDSPEIAQATKPTGQLATSGYASILSAANAPIPATNLSITTNTSNTTGPVVVDAVTSVTQPAPVKISTFRKPKPAPVTTPQAGSEWE